VKGMDGESRNEWLYGQIAVQNKRESTIISPIMPLYPSRIFLLQHLYTLTLAKPSSIVFGIRARLGLFKSCDRGIAVTSSIDYSPQLSLLVVIRRGGRRRKKREDEGRRG